MMGPVHQSTDGKVMVIILAKPGAKQNAITDISEAGIGVQVAAPPVDGKANMELVKFMAKTLEVRKSDVVLERGSKSHLKTLAITGKSREDVLGMIRSQIETDH
ncbi:UPF0235 protein C15orf40 homolog [Saccostrea echinata]|uniref:UPF0235 protein C15orf40 homolog n=1 Tax=Saccostrea echinata TaxID=191078 RepID=UPI002A7EE644|nr:UPF0235 protein C15orf40 homolog [Saccostrea echinata]